MASAWGIDIGQAGLKAIRLRSDEDGQNVRATAFDYIPHPKILSQPDAIPEELISQAVSTFLSRNQVGSDLISISVPGHTSLAKFIKLPPVEPSKVAEIVSYEAKQQIPFDLDEVVWDYQPIGGGVEESGFMLEAEVGLFAMKREQIYEAMAPLTDHGVEVELVQVAPLGLYNYLSYDVLGFRKTEEQPEPPASEDHYILLDMGADNTTLLVSNGQNIWIRNVPIGGNHFTRALTREMKLTFAKAEHLKCNATKSPDPKAIFQAMRPVFNDYVTEIQRSIGYFGSVNRSAKIKKVIGIGNGFKLAGLQKFLQQNLQYEVERLEHLNGVTGDGVLTDPLFMDNMMTFAVPYGLALQTLQQTRIRTTLLPPEIVVDRTIRRKKPWAVAAAAGLLLAMGISTFASARVLQSVSEDKWSDGFGTVSQLKSKVASFDGDYQAQVSEHSKLLSDIEQLAAPIERREIWMEVFKAVNECLPVDEGDDLDQEDPTLQRRIRVNELVSKKVSDLASWHSTLISGGIAEDFHKDDAENPPTGEGYVFTITGYHFHNNDSLNLGDTGEDFIDHTLRDNLRKWIIEKSGTQIPVGQIGISHPVVVFYKTTPFLYDPDARIGNPAMNGGMMTPGGGYEGVGRSAYSSGGAYEGGGYESGTMSEGYGGPSGYPGSGSGLGTPDSSQTGPALGPLDSIDEDEDRRRMIPRTDFVLQFIWKPTLEQDRLELPPDSGEAAPE